MAKKKNIDVKIAKGFTLVDILRSDDGRMISLICRKISNRGFLRQTRSKIVRIPKGFKIIRIENHKPRLNTVRVSLIKI